MKRQEAIDQAHSFLDSRRGRKLKERADRNPNLNYMSLAHLVADVIQRKGNAREFDFQELDLAGTSYQNLRDQIRELIKRQTGDIGFESEKKERFENSMERARDRQRQSARRHASRVNEARPDWNQYVDQTKNAETTFADPTERQMEKWQNNPNKYDIKGVDTRTNPSERPQTELPFQRRRNVLYSGSKDDLKKSMRKIPASIKRNATGQKKKASGKIDQYSELLDKSVGGGPQAQSIAIQRSGPNITERQKLGVSKAKKLMDRHRQRMKDKIAMTEFEREERMEADSNFGSKLKPDEGSRASKILKDSREIGTIGKNLRGNTSERSNQQSLRDGFASLKSEKDLEDLIE